MTLLISEEILRKEFTDSGHFFRANSWKLETIQEKWVSIVASSGLIYRVCGKPLLIGDGVKQSKEGRKMRRVSKLGNKQ